MLCCAIELGIFDIMTEVSCLLQHLCAPQVNHLESVYKIYHYMRKNIKHNRGRLGFDSTLQYIDDKLFDDQNKVIYQWRYFYPKDIDRFHMACQRHWVSLCKLSNISMQITLATSLTGGHI